MRLDEESAIGDGASTHDKICGDLIKEGYTCAVGDWGAGHHTKQSQSPGSLNKPTIVRTQVKLQTKVQTKRRIFTLQIP